MIFLKLWVRSVTDWTRKLWFIDFATLQNEAYNNNKKNKTKKTKTKTMSIKTNLRSHVLLHLVNPPRMRD